MDLVANLADNIAIGLASALSTTNLFYCFVGVFFGMFIGVIPGIGALPAIAMLFPITFHLDPTAALIMLAGIYYGTAYGGSTAAILLNLPGTPSSAVVCLDGYPMSKQGRSGVALLITAVASFVGGSIGILLMMLFSPIIATYALSFGSAEYVALMVLGLVTASTISTGSPVKGIAMVVFGILLGLVGTDINTGMPRLHFGFLELVEGISLPALAMGLFGVSEVIYSVFQVAPGQVKRKSITFRSMVPSKEDVRRSCFPILRGSGIGSFLGTLPGTGPMIASFMAYAVEKRISAEPWRFGNGAIEGVAAPESANNAAEQTAFIPTMTLGIPGSATMALMLGVMMIHGITPGPQLIVEEPTIFWGLIMSFWVGNLLLLVLNIPMIGIWIRVLTVPYHLMYPAILIFVCIGVYSVYNSIVDVWLVIIFGLLGYFLRILGFSPAPLILGFVLGPLLEENFRRAMVLSRGDFMTFFDRPISGAIMFATIALLIWAVWSSIRSGQKQLRATGSE